MSNWIAETVTTGVGWSHLERLADIGNRMAGSEGERAGAEATRDAFDGVGARNARLDAFDLQRWTRGSSSLAHLDSGETADCIALPRSPNALATGELVDLGCGLPSDFEGEAVTVAVEADIHDATSRNVHAQLGPDTDEAVLLTSHVDAHDISERAGTRS